MKKPIFVLIAFCFAISSAFAQITFEPKLSEDHPEEEAAIPDHQDNEVGRIFVRINGMPDDQGRTPVQIELENKSEVYDFLLFDRARSKKELRREWKIYFDKRFPGESTIPVEMISLDEFQSRLIPRNSFMRYTFRDILVEEGHVYECKIPIHMTKPKGRSKRKKVLQSIIECTIRVSVDNRDEVYEKLKSECDSLTIALNEALAREEFCTHPNHPLSFEAQTWNFTIACHDLKEQISRPLFDKSLPSDSKKFVRYQALLDSLNKMDIVIEKYKQEKHECGKERVKTASCRYCSLSFEEIYNRLDRYYKDLYNKEKQKSEVMRDVNALYNCCKSHAKHSKKWNSSNPYKARIEEVYNKIKNYKE